MKNKLKSAPIREQAVESALLNSRAYTQDSTGKTSCVLRATPLTFNDVYIKSKILDRNDMA
jgi:hypothetical protein